MPGDQARRGGVFLGPTKFGDPAITPKIFSRQKVVVIRPSENVFRGPLWLSTGLPRSASDIVEALNRSV